VNAGYTHLVRLLVKSGADVKVPFEGFVKSKSSRQIGSVLQLAIELGNRDIVSFLREHSAQEEVESYVYRAIRLWWEEKTHRTQTRSEERDYGDIWESTVVRALY
jgi:hypothetical protein